MALSCSCSATACSLGATPALLAALANSTLHYATLSQPDAPQWPFGLVTTTAFPVSLSGLHG